MKPSKLNRRQFLLAAGAGGATAATALIAGKNAEQAAVPVAAAPQQPAVKGYHVSEHIEKYYKTTQI
jgi:nitrous oxide reductase